MRSRKTSLSPLFRSLAALALVVFVAAQTMCFVHCHFGGGPVDAAKPSCHGSPRTTASHDGPDKPTPPTPASAATCSTLKTMLSGGGAPKFAVPQHYTLSPLTLISLALDATETQPESSFSRQAWPRDWVFTPLVCLGPAFRSLAPPLVG
jgi:hypothetical protein